MGFRVCLRIFERWSVIGFGFFMAALDLSKASGFTLD
jgi:hypothetical protein